MGTYREWVEELKAEWTGKEVLYEGKKYTVMNVDYNGFLLINKMTEHTETTAVSRLEVKNEIVETPPPGGVRSGRQPDR